MPPKTPAPQDPAPVVEAAPVAPADDADKNADFAPVNMELPDIQSKFATLYTNLEKEQRARYGFLFFHHLLPLHLFFVVQICLSGASLMKNVSWTCANM